MLKTLGEIFGELAWGRVLDAVVLEAILIALGWFAYWVRGKKVKIEPDKRWVAIVVGGLLLFCAAYLAITGASYLNAQMQAMQGSGTRGAMRLGILRTSIGSADDSSTGITFVIRAVNSGPRSTAWGWKLTTELPTGQLYHSYAPPGVGINHLSNPGELPLVLNDSNNLPRLLKQPLENGDEKIGWVWFKIDGLPVHSLPIGTRFTVECEDADQRRVVTQSVWDGKLRKLSGPRLQ